MDGIGLKPHGSLYPAAGSQQEPALLQAREAASSQPPVPSQPETPQPAQQAQLKRTRLDTEMLEAAQESHAKRARYAVEKNFQTESSPAFRRRVQAALAALELSAEDKKLLDAEIRGGLAYVALGYSTAHSKPVSLLWKSTFNVLESLVQKGLHLKEDFLLLKAPDDDEENLGYGGMLINKRALEQQLQADPELFQGCNYFAGISNFDDLLNRLETQQCSAALLEDECALGILLGYGKGNVQRYTSSQHNDAGWRNKGIQEAEQSEMKTRWLMEAIYDMLSPAPAELNAVERILQDNRSHALQEIHDFLAAAPESDAPCGLDYPRFIFWDSPESTATCLQTLRDSIAIERAYMESGLREEPSVALCLNIFDEPRPASHSS